MTERETRDALARWVKRLGLGRWDITLHFNADVEGCDCRAWRSDDYETARIYFPSEWTDDEYAERHLVHELLHLLTRDLDEAAALPRQRLGDEAAAACREAWLHQYEGTIEILARVLVG